MGSTSDDELFGPAEQRSSFLCENEQLIEAAGRAIEYCETNRVQLVKSGFGPTAVHSLHPFDDVEDLYGLFTHGLGDAFKEEADRT